MDTELTEIVERVGTSFTEFKTAYEAKLLDIEKRLNRPGMQFETTNGGLAEGKANLSTWMRTGERKSSPGMSIDVDPAGGFTVDDTVSNQITKTIFETSPFRPYARVIPIQTDRFVELIDKDDLSANWVDETTPRDATTTPDWAELAIPVYEISAEPRASQQLLEDSSIDIAGWLTDKVSDKFGRVETAAFFNGTGIRQPRGLFTYPTAATSDASRPWGTFQHVATGVSGAFAASNPSDILFDLIGAMKPGYRTGAVWMMPRSVITQIRKFKENTTNAYIWQPGLQLDQPDRLLGYPVLDCVDIPDPTSGSLSIAFVNLARAYTIVDRVGIQVLRDPYTARPSVVFATRKRVGGGAANFEAAKFAKFS